ncbi:hypothetical protein Tco_1184784 [Tanacetum coccineum]
MLGVVVFVYHTPSSALTTSQPPLLSPSRIPTRQETEVPQPSSPTYTNVADEAALTNVDVVHGGAASTVSSIRCRTGSGFAAHSLPDAGLTWFPYTGFRSQNRQSEYQLGVHSAAKVLADAIQEAKFNAEQEELLASETTKDKANPPVADIDWDDVQAQIQANEDLAQKLVEEERENLSIEERARLLAELIDKRKKLQAAQRYEAIRNKPQTMSQQRKTMCTYMKNMAGYKMEHFKGKSFYEVKEMFDNVYKQVTSFVPMDSVMEKERTKRAGLNLQEESSKRQKTREGSEPTEELKADETSQEDLQQMIMVVPVEEVYVEALQKFDRDDLDKLWSLVKERFSSTDPTDDKKRTLWVELKRLFELDTDDILWKLQSMRMEQYLTHTDYTLWEVIVNGDAPTIALTSAGTEGINDSKTVWEQPRPRFGATKNQENAKNHCKAAIENFAASRSKDKIKPMIGYDQNPSAKWKFMFESYLCNMLTKRVKDLKEDRKEI